MKEVWLGENGGKPYFSAGLILLTSKIDAQNDKKLEQILKGIDKAWNKRNGFFLMALTNGFNGQGYGLICRQV